MRPPGTGGGPVALFDSGIGGLPYLSAARSDLPLETFIYIADRAGFPYGTKTRVEVKARVLRLIRRLVEDYGPKALVIACNTASQAALEAARRSNPGLPIIGTVPAVKPAAERTRSGVIGVLGSAGAVEDPYLDGLVARHAEGVTVIREGAQELVTFVERRLAFADEAERRAAVAPFVRRLVDRGADEIVLACTHFLHLGEAIAAEAGPSVEVVDSREGVVKRLRQVLGERGLLNGVGTAAPGHGTGGEARGTFLVSGAAPIESEYSFFARTFRLAEPGLARD